MVTSGEGVGDGDAMLVATLLLVGTAASLLADATAGATGAAVDWSRAVNAVDTSKGAGASTGDTFEGACC